MKNGFESALARTMACFANHEGARAFAQNLHQKETVKTLHHLRDPEGGGGGNAFFRACPYPSAVVEHMAATASGRGSRCADPLVLGVAGLGMHLTRYACRRAGQFCTEISVEELTTVLGKIPTGGPQDPLPRPAQYPALTSAMRAVVRREPCLRALLSAAWHVTDTLPGDPAFRALDPYQMFFVGCAGAGTQFPELAEARPLPASWPGVVSLSPFDPGPDGEGEQ